MAFSRPTLPYLQKRIYTDLCDKSGLKSPLKKSILKAFSYALAGVAYMLFGFLDYIYKQAFPTTCDEVVLIVWAYIYDVPRKIASFSERVVQFSGVNGSVIEALTILKWSDGTEFVTQEEVTISSGIATVRVKCSSAGTIGNLDFGFKLSLTTPVSGVQSQALILEENQLDGQNEEDPELWRERILLKIKEPPHGGNENDYKIWTLSIPGVTRAWVKPQWLGDGTVGVTFVNDSAVDIFPDEDFVEEVLQILDELRPVTADVIVFSPVRQEIDFNIQINPNTSSVRDAVTENLKDLFKREAEPGGLIQISHVREAISLAVGESDHVLISPTSNITSPTGNLAVVGAITFGNIT